MTADTRGGQAATASYTAPMPREREQATDEETSLRHADAPNGIVSGLRLRHISKRYGPAQVLHAVSLDVGQGRLHALLGGNGSGKSTLVKILAGVERAEPGGVIRIADHMIDASRVTPHVARENGLHFVHQDPGIIADLSVADNLFIGHGYATGWFFRISSRRLRRMADEIIERFELNMSPSTRAGDLSAGQRTLLAIARALHPTAESERGILVLDEPTASLPERDAGHLLTALRSFAENGHTVVYVTHRLGEVCGIADEVSVLRDGRYVGCVPGATADEQALIPLILGREVSKQIGHAEVTVAAEPEPVLELRGISVGPLKQLDLTVNKGEILGVAGLLGSGRSTLLKVLFGALQPDSGDVCIHGRPVSFRTPQQAMNAGIACVPEERLETALFPELSVRENLLIASTTDFWRRGWLSSRLEQREAARLIEDTRITHGSQDQPISTLSGGNQQKVVLGRWLRREPQILLLDEPTQGVDVGARSELYQLVRDAARGGAAVLLVASDLAELAAVSDRVVVLRDGWMVHEVAAPPIDPAVLASWAYSDEGQSDDSA